MFRATTVGELILELKRYAPETNLEGEHQVKYDTEYNTVVVEFLEVEYPYGKENEPR